MTSDPIVSVLLLVAVATALFSTLGLVLMKDIHERLHYLAPLSTLSAFLIATAIVIKEGLSQATTKAILAAVAVALMNPILTHATARAGRVRQYGHWVSQPEEGERKAGD